MALVDKVIGFVAVNKSFNRKLVRWLLPDAFHEAVSTYSLRPSLINVSAVGA